mmetsp:Transcript_155090/g.497260  ORF Transcript_155090/g.497260 Transcript_155090/m.497260 type:complete len:356 (-) Transcript_155090:1923-2990(-)
MSIFNAKCPAMKTTQPIRAALTFSTVALPSNAEASPAPTAAPSVPLSRASSAPDASQIGIASALGGALPDLSRTLQSIRPKICSHNLSGHCWTPWLACGEKASSKDKSMAACAAPNHSAGTDSRAKHSTSTQTACWQRLHKCFQASSDNGALLHVYRRYSMWQSKRLRSSTSAGVVPAAEPLGPMSSAMRGSCSASCVPLAAPSAVNARRAMGQAGVESEATSSGMAPLMSMNPFSAESWINSCTLAKCVYVQETPVQPCSYISSMERTAVTVSRPSRCMRLKASTAASLMGGWRLQTRPSTWSKAFVAAGTPLRRSSTTTLIASVTSVLVFEERRPRRRDSAASRSSTKCRRCA